MDDQIDQINQWPYFAELTSLAVEESAGMVRIRRALTGLVGSAAC